MKILLVNTFYYPNMPGGAEQSVKLLVENLSKKGHNVAVYCADSKDGVRREENVNGIKVYRCTTGRFQLYKFSYEKYKVGKIEKITQKLLTYFNPATKTDFQWVCNQFKPDIIHTNTLYGISWNIWKYAHKHGIAVVHTIRDTGIISPVQYGHVVNPLVLKAHQIYMRKMTKYVDVATAPSEYTLRRSLEIGSFKNAAVKRCIYNSIEVNLEQVQAVIHEKQNRTSSVVKFMYAGRLLPFKGISHMIEAFKRLEDEKCQLHICGDGEMVEFVKDATKEDKRIIYCGKLNNDELVKKYIECDVLLVPSVWPEPFGRVVIEGNKYGLPIIAGKCGGIPEIMKVIQGGKLYEAGNLSELVSNMNYFLHRENYPQYYANINDKITVFGIEKQVHSFMEIYNGLICN